MSETSTLIGYVGAPSIEKNWPSFPHRRQRQLTNPYLIMKSFRALVEDARIPSHWRGPRRVRSIAGRHEDVRRARS